MSMGSNWKHLWDAQGSPVLLWWWECRRRDGGGEMKVTSCRNNNVTGQGFLWIIRGKKTLQGCASPAKEDNKCFSGVAGWQKFMPAAVLCSAEAGLTDRYGPLKWAIFLPDCSPLGSDFLNANHQSMQKLAYCVASLVAPLVGSSAAVLGSWWDFIKVITCFQNLGVKRGHKLLWLHVKCNSWDKRKRGKGICFAFT